MICSRCGADGAFRFEDEVYCGPCSAVTSNEACSLMYCDTCGDVIPDADKRWAVIREDRVIQWHGDCDPPEGVTLEELSTPHPWEYRDQS